MKRPIVAWSSSSSYPCTKRSGQLVHDEKEEEMPIEVDVVRASNMPTPPTTVDSRVTPSYKETS